MDTNTHFDFTETQKFPFLSSPMSPAMTPLLYNPISPVMTPLLNNISETTHSRHELSQKGHPHIGFGSFSSTQTSCIKSPGLTEKNENYMKKTLKKFKSMHTHDEKPENEEKLGDIAEQKSLEDIFSPVKQKHGNAMLNKEYKILFDIKEDYLPANKIEEYKEDSLNLREHEEDMRHFHSIFPTKKQVFVLPLSSPVVAKNTLRIDPIKLQELEFDSISKNRGK